MDINYIHEMIYMLKVYRRGSDTKQKGTRIVTKNSRCKIIKLFRVKKLTQ